ncbi:MAG: efflux RND transporter periplasmic adaptor subunit, partial [Pseudomonadales bacterium]|nr:efflux RND transporter periplasmic adaptor subunit [Pseudomonadales bacterium]
MRVLYPRVFLTLLVLLMLVACGNPDDRGVPVPGIAAAQPSAPQPVKVRVAAVQNLQRDEVLRFAGVARARQRANLSFQVEGSLEARLVEIGQQVEQDQIVARLYNPQLAPAAAAAQARLEQLQSDIEQTRRDLERMEQLHARGVLAYQVLEQQRSLVQSTLAAIANAEAVLVQTRQLNRETVLRAPFSGRIEAVLLEPGEFAQPGQPVMRISAETGLEVEVKVPPHMLSALNTGQVVPVWHSLNGTKFEGLVTETGESSFGDNALYPLIVSLEGRGLRSGEALEVGVPLRSTGRLAIPANAVMRSARGLSVFRIHDGRARRVMIEVVRISGEQA